MPMSELSSAAWILRMPRLAMRLPMVARRSPAMTRPPLQVSATIVVPCGASTTPAAPVARPPGSRPGSTAATKPVKEELPAAR